MIRDQTINTFVKITSEMFAAALENVESQSFFAIDNVDLNAPHTEDHCKLTVDCIVFLLL